jgi:hypothetical protein
MNRIFSAGGNHKTWLDNVPGEEAEVVEEDANKIGVDALSTNDLRKLAQFSFEVEETIDGDVAVEDAVVDDGEPPLDDEPISDEIVEDEIGGEGGEGGEGDPLDEAAEAVADAQDALEDAAVSLTDAGAAPVEDELAEIPVSIEEEGIVDDDADADGLDLGDGPDSAVVVELEGPEAEANSYAEAAPEVQASAGNDKFVKIATLSPANKKKLKSYWVKTLGYDTEWVSQMLKDYK